MISCISLDVSNLYLAAIGRCVLSVHTCCMMFSFIDLRMFDISFLCVEPITYYSRIVQMLCFHDEFSFFCH